MEDHYLSTNDLSGVCNIDNIDNSNSYIMLETSDYTALWRAVIMQAFVDLSTGSSRTDDRIAQYQARLWFVEASGDFYSICTMANYDANYVRNKALKIIKKIEIANPQKKKTSRKKSFIKTDLETSKGTLINGGKKIEIANPQKKKTSRKKSFIKTDLETNKLYCSSY